MYELLVESEFAAAHRLRGYQGACENLHGHNWRVEVVLAGEQLDALGMLVDFRDVKKIVNATLDEFDHRYLNDLPAFQEMNPTTENLARLVYHDCGRRLPAGVRVRSVTVWESPRCGARYSEDSPASSEIAPPEITSKPSFDE